MRQIVDVLKKLAPIAHFTYWPADEATDEEYSTLPIVWWTYEHPSEEIAEFLQRAIGGFKGTVAWEVLTTGRRWILMPARIREYAELHGCDGDLIAAAELEDTEPDFCERATADMRPLAEHLFCCWNDGRATLP